MHALKRLSANCANRLLLILALIVLASSGSACGKKDAVVIQPIAVRKVPAELMVRPPTPACDADVPAEGIEPRRLNRSKDCWKAAYQSADARLGGLQTAVRKRQNAVDAAFKAAK